jgi:hypothetical protein
MARTWPQEEFHSLPPKRFSTLPPPDKGHTQMQFCWLLEGRLDQEIHGYPNISYKTSLWLIRSFRGGVRSRERERERERERALSLARSLSLSLSLQLSLQLWLLVSGSWFLVPGSWFLVPGSWSLAPGSKFLVLDSRQSSLRGPCVTW